MLYLGLCFFIRFDSRISASSRYRPCGIQPAHPAIKLVLGAGFPMKYERSLFLRTTLFPRIILHLCRLKYIDAGLVGHTLLSCSVLLAPMKPAHSFPVYFLVNLLSTCTTRAAATGEFFYSSLCVRTLILLPKRTGMGFLYSATCSGVP